jgi:hypothetical protein
MNAEFTGLVRSGGHDAAAVPGKAPYDNRLPPVFGMIELFHGGVKCVKIRMDKTGHNVSLTHVKAALEKEQEALENFGAMIYNVVEGASNPTGVSLKLKNRNT